MSMPNKKEGEKSYLDKLVEIGERIENASEEKNERQLQNWFAYLQGYIRAYKEINNK